MFNKFITAAVAAFSVALPATATIQPGTPDLIRTVAEHMTVVFNKGATCAKPGVVGSYQLSNKTLTLCPGLEVDADDHDTVRHEVWHAIQHCLSSPGARSLEPVIEVGTKEYWDLVANNLSIKQAKFIQDSYPERAWHVENEAFVAAATLTSSQIEDIFIDSCVD